MWAREAGVLLGVVAGDPGDRGPGSVRGERKWPPGRRGLLGLGESKDPPGKTASLGSPNQW